VFIFLQQLGLIIFFFFLLLRSNPRAVERLGGAVKLAVLSWAEQRAGLKLTLTAPVRWLG
jgi:hypothetical protein